MARHYEGSYIVLHSAKHNFDKTTNIFIEWVNPERPPEKRHAFYKAEIKDWLTFKELYDLGRLKHGRLILHMKNNYTLQRVGG